MVRETYERMPQAVKLALNGYKKLYRSAKALDGTDYTRRDKIRTEASAYCKGLRDAGLVTDRERGYLYIYTTV